MKEMCRTHISMENECGYCSTVRSKIAQEQGLTEENVMALPSFEKSETFDDRERRALRYAPLFKQGEHATNRDEVYDDLKKVFSEDEIIEPGQLYAQSDGVGKLVKSFNVMSWGEACEISPDLTKTKNAIAAE